MILVDITAAYCAQTFSFQIEETARIADVIEEVVSLISQKTKKNLTAGESALLLCGRMGEKLFDPGQTLAAYGVSNGAELFLV